MQTMKYRSDIDGLRAIAVLPVLFFHVGWNLFSGGFVGVDVFFVISGFLITHTLVHEIDAGDFSIARFYERRARRILPALFATVLATTIASLIIFMPDELREFGSRVVAVAWFASNILFWRQADYFAGPTEMEPLIHTWSLAVEEQYYILFPLLLVGIARWGKRRYFAPVAILALLSFTLSVLLLKVDATGDYYLLPTRAWELLIGSLLACGNLRRIERPLAAEILAAGGAALILGSAMLLTSTSTFPGFNALWPCLGAAAILHANSGRTTWTGRVLGLRPFVWIGLISYSLYLIHWPLIVFARYLLLRDFTPVEKTLLIAVSVALAALSWRFVERPFRNRHKVSRRAIFTGSLVAILISTVVGSALYVLKGLPQRFPGLHRFVDEARPTDRHEPACFLAKGFDTWAGDACYLTRGVGPTTLLWGDSHAHQYRDALIGAGAAAVPNLLLYSSGGCIPVLDVDVAGRPFCRANNDHALSVIRHYHVRTVILSGNWDYTLKSSRIEIAAVARSIARLRAMGVRVKLIGDNPFYTFNNPRYLGYRLSQRERPDDPYFLAAANDWKVNDGLRQAVGADNFFDPADVLCSEHKCLVYARRQLVMSDIGHLSHFGSKLVLARMGPFLKR